MVKLGRHKCQANCQAWCQAHSTWPIWPDIKVSRQHKVGSLIFFSRRKPASPQLPLQFSQTQASQHNCNSFSKRLAKLFHRGKCGYFVRKILSNIVFIFLSLFSHSQFYISDYLNLLSRAASHLCDQLSMRALLVTCGLTLAWHI
jgi:hypothetical protein